MFQRYFTPFSFLLVFSLGFFAKTQAQNLISITGKVITYEQSKPLEYVSLKLFQLPDSTFIKGSFTNPEGRFEIMAPAGKYYIQMSVALYENEQTEAFETYFHPLIYNINTHFEKRLKFLLVTFSNFEKI
jgi:hypothetical protein